MLKLVKNPYIAFSGGKDSTVLSHLVRQLKPDIPHVFFDAKCSFPETQEFLKRMSKKINLIIYEIKEPFLETLKRKGLLDPLIESETMKVTVYQPIREILAKYKFDGVFLGLRAHESIGRSQLLRSKSKIFFNKRDNIWQFLPLGWWKASEIWMYIDVKNLDYNRVYDVYTPLQPREELRCSYWAGETNRRRGRFVYLKYYYPSLWNELLAKRPEAGYFI